jgi:uncharacterized protein YjdB
MHMTFPVRRGVLALVMTTVACGGDSAGPSTTVIPDAVARVDLSPATLSLLAGASGTITATVYGSRGTVLTGRALAWSSGNTSVATVGQTGLVTAVSAGTATITATAEGIAGTAVVTVTAAGTGTIVRVDITPTSASVAVGASVQLTGLAYDAQGRVSTAEPYLWAVDNPVIASVSQNGLVTGLAAGTAQVTMSAAGFSKTVTVTVTSTTTVGNVIDVLPGVTYQTMTGWQGGGQNGWLECNPTAFSLYKDQLHDRLINELGIERVTIALRSGSENTRDYFADYLAGRIDMAAWRNTWYAPVNDNASPTSTDNTKFFWSYLDGFMDNTILPLRQRMAARGEQLRLVVSYVDFDQNGVTKTLLHLKAPDEYAEFVTAAFQHLRSKYGIVPDGLELVLEPEHTTYTSTDIGRALVAVSARLRANGFNPDIYGPSTTSMYNASVYYDGMMQVPGAKGLLSELVYHRYVAVSYANLVAIGQRSQRDGVKTSMLEHIGSGFDDLYEDLTVANASSWMQFSNAFCGNRDNPDNQGVYYQINQTDPSNPKINITNSSKLFRQLFNYVRRGAVRIGAATGNATDLLPLAFRNANGRLVVVVRAKRGATFQVRGLPAGTYGINFGTPGAQWNVSLADQTIPGGGTIQTGIPSDGVITIYGK